MEYQTGVQAATGGDSGQAEPKGYLKRLLDYAVDSPAKTLSLTVLTYGGVLLWVYFARINFLPDVNLDAVTSVLYAVALVGLLLAGYTAATLAMPGLVLGVARDGHPAIEDKHVGMVASAGAMAWGVVVAGILYERNCYFWGAVVVAAILYVAVWQLLGRHQLKQAHKHESVDVEASKSTPWLWMLSAGVGCAALMLLPLALLAVLGLNGNLRRADDHSVLLSLFMTVVVIAAAAALLGATKAHKRWRVALLIAPIMLFFTSMLLDSFSAVSVVAVRKLGLGEQYFVRAVVSGKTCKVVNQALGQNVCDPQAEDDAPTAICPAVLRSRIGSQVLLEFSGIKLEGAPTKLIWATPSGIKVDVKEEPFFRRVVLPKEQLLTWSNLSQQVEQAASAPVSNVLASWLPKDSGGEAQPEALAKALVAVCQEPKPPKVPDTSASASGPAIAASVPTLIKIDAKGSASHQTVVNVQLQNAVSQNASALSAAGAKSGADAKVLIRRQPPQAPKCAAMGGSANCCQPACCGTLARDVVRPLPTCAASTPD